VLDAAGEQVEGEPDHTEEDDAEQQQVHVEELLAPSRNWGR
jgi:hypothetical protein